MVRRAVWLAGLAAALSGCGSSGGVTAAGSDTSGSGGGSSGTGSSSGGASSSSGGSGGIHVVNAHTSDALSGNGLAAAMQWRAYPQALLDCLAPIEVNGPLHPEVSPVDEATWRDLALCAQLYAYGRVVAEGVSLPGNNQSFDVPVSGVPTPALVTGPEGSALGLGAVVVFQDANGNSRLDMVTPGSRESVDTVLGASVAVDEESTEDMMVVYRSGAVSPLWKLFVGIYGCPQEPPQGFSIMRNGFDTYTGFPVCTLLEDGVVEVQLRSVEAMRHLICLPTDTGPAYRFPDNPLPANATSSCVDEWTLYFTTTPDSVCPILEHYDLVGCSDTSTPAACENSVWDIRDNPPSWWPCGSGGEGANLVVVDDPSDVSDGQDTLFRIEHRGGTLTIPMASLRVTVTVDEQGNTVVLDGSTLTLVDGDSNGVFSAGDRVTVAEAGINLFGSLTEPGNYPVSVQDTRGTPARALASFYWTPKPLLPPLGATLQFNVADARAPLTEGPDELMDITYLAGDRALRVADVQVSVAYSCEAPVEFRGTAQLLLADLDADGLWDPGEVLTVRESAGTQGFGPFDGNTTHCVSIQLRRGFNVHETVGGDLWETVTLQLVDAPDTLTAGADALFRLDFVDGWDTHALSDLSVDVYQYSPSMGSTLLHTFTAAAGELALTDVDADGRFGRGDALRVSEVVPVAALSQERVTTYVSLRLPNSVPLGNGWSWESGAP